MEELQTALAMDRHAESKKLIRVNPRCQRCQCLKQRIPPAEQHNTPQLCQ